MEKTILVNHYRSLSLTVIQAILNEAACFKSTTGLMFNDRYVNLKSMRNSAIFFQEPLIGELTISCFGCDDYYALTQMTKVMQRYLVSEDRKSDL